MTQHLGLHYTIRFLEVEILSCRMEDKPIMARQYLQLLDAVNVLKDLAENGQPLTSKNGVSYCEKAQAWINSLGAK